MKVMLTKSEKVRRNKVWKKNRKRHSTPAHRLWIARQLSENSKGPQRLRAYLAAFWKANGGHKNNGYGLSPKRKMNWLKEMARVKVRYRCQQPITARRAEFERVKMQRHSLHSHPQCFVCEARAVARHHIISLANGGINCKRNCVSVCETCHDVLHPWMPAARAKFAANEINADLDRQFFAAVSGDF